MARTGFWRLAQQEEKAPLRPHESPFGPHETAAVMSGMPDPPKTSDPTHKTPLPPSTQSLSQDVAEKMNDGSGQASSSSLSGSGAGQMAQKDSFLQSLENPIKTHVLPLSMFTGEAAGNECPLKRKLVSEGSEMSSKQEGVKPKGPEKKPKANFCIVP